MTLPKYAQSISKNRLVNIHCRGGCQTGRWAKIIANDDNDGGTEITSNSFAECLMCKYIASDQSNWRKA